MVDALRSGRSAIISGVGGIGKTELLAQALNRAETGRPVLWIDVDQFRTTLDLISALRAALATNGVACSEDAIGPQLDELQACLVFDGIERGLVSDLEELEDAIASLFANP
jgi:ATP/maltotriose-dependent transcriptional regulator MalT